MQNYRRLPVIFGSCRMTEAERPPAHPRVLAVIPCLNEEAHLERLVRGLAEGAGAPSLLIVVADGGSTDRTPDIARRLAARYANVKYLHNPKRLQSAAVNLAVGV